MNAVTESQLTNWLFSSVDATDLSVFISVIYKGSGDLIDPECDCFTRLDGLEDHLLSRQGKPGFICVQTHWLYVKIWDTVIVFPIKMTWYNFHNRMYAM